MNDVIYRQEAIDALCKLARDCFSLSDDTYKIIIETLLKADEAIRALPSALEKQDERNTLPNNDISILTCPFCGSGEYIHNANKNRKIYCGECGMRIDWSE